jgi:hypothetical protein
VTDELWKPAIEVVELDDLSELAAELGFRCPVSMTQALADEVAPRAALLRLREVLLATPNLEMFRSVALLGDEALALLPGASYALIADIRDFMARVRAGEEGANEGGTMLAMTVGGRSGDVMVVCRLGYGVAQPQRNPRVVLGLVDMDGLFFEPPPPRKLPP